MAGRGMGAATQGGGAVSSGPRNKMQSNPAAKSTGIPMLNKGGFISPRKRMAMGEDITAKDGGAVAKKMKHGGAAKKMNYGGMTGKMMRKGGRA